LYTNHVWEDYYITYRSSKNLATGYGLVYNHGDRLHTFTSPLGVLLPAAASLLTANTSDTAALWLFRLMCIAAFAGGAALLVGLVHRLDYPGAAVVFLAGLLVLDAKSLDFAINGMETGFMLLFLGYALWAHLTPGPGRWAHLGAAWAGLMWTRPDSFIYIALVAAGFWLFNEPARTGGNRRQQFGLFLRAGLLTAALYGPWLLWANWYYGTPIPHTIAAKAAQAGDQALPRVLAGFWRLPVLIWQGKTAVEGSFLPAYHVFPEWPAWMLSWGRGLGTLACLLWLVPGVRRETRVASLAFYGGMVYLSFVPYYPFPWYYPTPAWLGYLAIAGMVAQLWDRAAGAAGPGSRPWLAAAIALPAVFGSLWLTLGVARQVRAQQTYIENGNRRLIGEWLRRESKPGDSVFLEPLGYIGYFSGLKTYDWPGMSSRELVEAKLVVGTNWGDLIRYLQPTWLVLRPDGDGDLPALSPVLNTISYELVREFNCLDAVQRLDVPGRKYLEFDARFRIYHLKNPTRQDADGLEIASPFGSSLRRIGTQEVRLVHAPGSMILDVPPGMNSVSGRYGFPPEASEGEPKTDGAKFQIYWTDGEKRLELFQHRLDPTGIPGDRPLQSYHLDLPAHRPGARVRLTFETDPAGRSATKDWTCWSRPVFHP
ncbi:MAG: hypothetical protein ACHQ5A_02930, partial [Opitutales bacterium]